MLVTCPAVCSTCRLTANPRSELSITSIVNLRSEFSVITSMISRFEKKILSGNAQRLWGRWAVWGEELRRMTEGVRFVPLCPKGVQPKTSCRLNASPAARGMPLRFESTDQRLCRSGCGLVAFCFLSLAVILGKVRVPRLANALVAKQPTSATFCHHREGPLFDSWGHGRPLRYIAQLVRSEGIGIIQM